MWRTVLGFVAALTPGTALADEAPSFLTQSTVYTRTSGGYDQVRIPSLVSTQTGVLLAFAEGRRADPASTHMDHGQNDILLRRSTDRGETWGPIIEVHADRTQVFVNPCAVVLPSDRVLLMYQAFPVGFHARPIGEHIQPLEPGYDGPHSSRTLLQWSDDGGATWTPPIDVTRQTKRPAPIISTASGPGIGIVLERGDHAGRVIIPTNEGWWEEDGRIFNVFACYSDDNGRSWAYGDVAPRGDGLMGDEVQMAERADGSVLLNSRTSFGNRRLTAHSTDGGATWSPLEKAEALPEPRCMGTILRYSWPEDGASRILFANPATAEHDNRTQGTVRVSYDEGATWPVAKVVVPGDFAYACLTKLDDGTIGLLCETEHYGKIEFIRFTIDWLEAGAPLKPSTP